MPRAELFDRAVNGALSYADRLGALTGDRDRVNLRSVLDLWYLKTRFAYRIELDAVVDILLTFPGPGHHWSGGREGGWRKGENPRP